MPPIKHLRLRFAPKPLAVCLGAALGLNVSASGHAPAAGRNAGAAPAGSLIVTNCDDDGPGSLRDVVARASTDASIDLTALTCSTITLTSGAVNTSVDDIRLTGPGPSRLEIVGGGVDRVIGHGGHGQIAIAGLTVRDGTITNGAGGCIYSAGSVRLFDAVVTGCKTYGTGTGNYLGGGVFARYSLSIDSSTLAHNLVSAPLGHAYGGGACCVSRGLFLSYATISDNVASGAIGNTGGIASFGDVFIVNSTISGNHAGYNAGLGLFARYATDLPLQISNSTISGNLADHVIGGVGVLGDVTIYSSTITENRDVGGGGATGGLFLGTNVAGDIESTIIARNFTGDVESDIGGYPGSTLTGAASLVIASTLPLPPGTLVADPGLGPLAANGGRTQSHALLPGSVAIGSGNRECDCIYDQRGRGFARTIGTAPDIGAYEVKSTGVTHTIANCGDSGEGSLRDAIDTAISGDAIDLASLGCSTITLTSGALEVTQGTLSLQGPGAGALTIDGNGNDRVFHHLGHGTLTLADVTIAHGYVVADDIAAGGCIADYGVSVLDAVTLSSCEAISLNGSSFGGAILAWTLDMRRSTVTASEAGAERGDALGGGVYASQLHIADSTISGNQVLPGAGNEGLGGGVYVDGYGTIVRSTITGNQASIGGGVYSGYIGRMLDSTVSGNAAFEVTGGIGARGRFAVYNSTVAFNTATGSSSFPAGLDIASGSARLESTIVFGNTAAGVAYDAGSGFDGVLIGSHNLIGTSHILLPPDTLHEDPLLGPLANNGGATMTHALGAASAAIDRGDNLASLDTDQRGAGFARVSGATADIGAFEVESGDAIFRDGFDGVARPTP